MKINVTQATPSCINHTNPSKILGINCFFMLYSYINLTSSGDSLAMDCLSEEESRTDSLNSF